MDGPTGSISIDIFRLRRRVDTGGMTRTSVRASAVARTAYAAYVASIAAAIVAHLPTHASADAGQAELHRVGAGIGIQSTRLEQGGLPAAGEAIRLPDVSASFGDAEPTVPVREPKDAIYRAVTPLNFEINLRLNPTTDEAECDVALRVLSPRDYYLVRIDGRGERVAFSRVSDGHAQEIASVERRVAANAWHSLSVGAEGSQFTVTLDGQRLFTAYDTVLRKSGRLAVWTAAGSTVRFDAIAVTALVAE